MLHCTMREWTKKLKRFISGFWLMLADAASDCKFTGGWQAELLIIC